MSKEWPKSTLGVLRNVIIGQLPYRSDEMELRCKRVN
jgi:hypothetical protein